MESLNGRVQKLEARERGRPPAPSRTQEVARALDAEIRKLEREMRVEGLDPDECLRGVSVNLPLDEHIALLEEEIALLKEEIERCPVD